MSKTAQVTINGRNTMSAGDRRVYLSRLQPGETYRFRIDVTDGEQTVRREVVLQAGQTRTLNAEDVAGLAGL